MPEPETAAPMVTLDGCRTTTHDGYGGPVGNCPDCQVRAFVSRQLAEDWDSPEDGVYDRL